MAVANSVTQIVLPGLDKVVQDQTVAAFAANPTIATIIANQAATGSAATLDAAIASANTAVTELLPPANPLPTFATYSCRDNRPFWNIYNSKLQPIDAGSQHTDSELWAPWTGNNYTNERFNSSSWTSYWSQATPYQQADGHWMMRLNAGNRTYTAVNADVSPSYMPYFGVIIGKRGIRQNISMWYQNSTLRIMERGIYNGYYENINLNNGTYSTWVSGTGYGSACYNDRTRTLVVIAAKDGSNNYRMHIWKNTGTDRSLNGDNYYPGTLAAFLREAKTGLLDAGQGAGVPSYAFYDFQWQANSSQNYSESQYRMRVVAGDNGIIGMARMVPSNVTHYATYNPATQQLTTSFNTIGLTTSYGYEQGERYGMRHNISWDNNWVVAYNCYYYYGSGMNVYFIDTRDPRNYFIGQAANSEQGCQLVPYQEDKFLFNNSNHNVDNNYGLRLHIIDPEGALQGRVTGGTIANGGTLGLQDNTQRGRFDTDYTSTNFPGLQTLAHWTRRV